MIVVGLIALGFGITWFIPDEGAKMPNILEAVNRAIGLAANGSLTVDDPNLQMHTAAELKAELEQATERSWADLNPFKVFRTRK